MRRKGTIAAMALVVLGNAVVLAGVAWNRSGEPDAVVTLTERELPLAWITEEDSGTLLRLSWLDVHRGGDYRSVRHQAPVARSWLDEAKLTELGFDCSVPVNARSRRQHYGKLLPREGYVVLEYEGTAWSDWLREQEEELVAEEEKLAAGDQTRERVDEIREVLEWNRRGASRLLSVDAGPDPVELRRRHADRARFLILPAVFSISTVESEVVGRIDRVLVDTLHVRRASADPLRGLGRSRRWRGDGNDPDPRYQVALRIGRRYEPWIEEISPLPLPPAR